MPHREVLERRVFDEWDLIVEVLCLPEIVAVSANYMDDAPLAGLIGFLHGLRYLLTISTQIFHTDINFERMVYFAVPVREVTEECGPLLCIPAPLSKIVITMLGNHLGRYTSEALGFTTTHEMQVDLLA